MAVTANRIRAVLGAHAATVEEALAFLFPDPDRPVNLDGLRETAEEGDDLADVLAAVLNDSGTSGSFIAFLGARGIELRPLQPNAPIWDAVRRRRGAESAIPEPEPNDFPFDPLAAFATRARQFRCRILLDRRVMGSGAFVSARLVLTAAHVIEELICARQPQPALPGADPAAVPAAGPHLHQIRILASDGRRYPARLVWHSPVHACEHDGGLPPPAEAASHRDVALLRVLLPLGHSYGHIELPPQPVEWTGPRMLALVHYPRGKARGFVSGRVLRRKDDIRLQHDIATEPGSSGGPGFDTDLRFIGLHQGRTGGRGRLVPHSQFAAEPAFLDAIRQDCPPRYLWSLDGNLDGPIIIGRQQFFAGLAAMVEQPDSLLRGLWIRRLDTSRATGLGFSFDMLRAFLASQRPAAQAMVRDVLWRVPTALSTENLLDGLARMALDRPAAEAHAGVRGHETSRVAEQRDRAQRLAQELQRRAEAEDRIFWFFLETPPGGELAEPVLAEFEHLVEWLVAHRNLRLILAGFEQYALAPLRFQNAEEALTARRPGLLVDPLGRFTDADIAVTLAAMLRDLTGEEALDPMLAEDMVRQVTHGLPQLHPGIYDFDHMRRATRRLQSCVRKRMGMR
ncbi:MAG: serine protease [Paracoccus sp. BP8]|nr:MAG: serine protease [Paracoccus sp. BP8]